MKYYISLIVILCAPPVLAHNTTLPHAHDASQVPLLLGLAFIITALIFGKFYKRAMQ